MCSNRRVLRCAAVLLLAAIARPAAAYGAGDFVAAESAFRELLDQARAAPVNPRSIVRFSAGNQNCEVLTEAPSLRPISLRVGSDSDSSRTARIAVKVWVELVRPDGQSRAGQFVNLEQHTWRSSQPFYLWFESATPIHIALFQVYADESTTARRARLVLPSPGIPSSFETLKPGRRARYPILFQTDNDLEPEHMAVVAFTPGAPLVERAPLPIHLLPQAPGGAQIQAAMLGTCQQLEAALNQAPERTLLNTRTRFAVVAPDHDDDGATNDPRRVAPILLGSGLVGHARFTLRKGP